MFVITAYPLAGKQLKAFRRRKRAGHEAWPGSVLRPRQARKRANPAGRTNTRARGRAKYSWHGKPPTKYTYAAMDDATAATLVRLFWK